MKISTIQIYEYLALDGRAFNSREDCLKHESELPDHLYICLVNKYNEQQLKTVNCWSVLELWETIDKEYEYPSFFHDGRWITVTNTHTRIIGSLKDVDMSQAVQWLVQNQFFSRSKTYAIKSLTFANC